MKYTAKYNTGIMKFILNDSKPIKREEIWGYIFVSGHETSDPMNALTNYYYCRVNRLRISEVIVRIGFVKQNLS